MSRRFRVYVTDYIADDMGTERQVLGGQVDVISLDAHREEGLIGTATALRAKALGMSVVFHDPYLPDGADKALGVTRADTLDGLLAAARVLSLHCPLTPETRRLIGDDALARLPPGAYLVNTA